jgi:diguanylate cyclase (GGDEF)-like protein
MPGIHLSDAVGISQRLRQAVAAATFETPAGPVRVTCSIGVATSAGHEARVKALLSRADKALYRAKQLGRDRVEAEEAPALAQPVGTA